MTLGQLADYADDLPLDLHVPRVDRGHRAVRGLQPDAVLLFVEPLQRCDVVLEYRDDDVAVARRVLLLHDDEVAVVDVVLDHGLTANFQYEGLASASRRELARESDALGAVLVGVDRLTCRDLSDDRSLHHATAVHARKTESS